MNMISKSKLDAIELLNKLNIAISEQNLVYYSQEGNIDNVRLLIEAGVSANAFYYIEENKKKWYYSPLYSAYTKNHLDIAELLIKNGANVNFIDDNNIIPTPINYAIEKNNAELLAFFIKNGADINLNKKKDNELIPIYQAIKLKYYDILKILIDNNVNLNYKSEIWGTVSPLTYSIGKMDSKASQMLIEANADLNLAVNSSEETPLIVAIRKKNIEIFKMLIEKGADVNKQRKDGKTPMAIAYQKKYNDFIIELTNANAKPLTEEEIKSATSLSVKNKFEGIIDLYRNNKVVKIVFWIIVIAMLIFLLGKGCSSCSKGSHNSTSNSSGTPSSSSSNSSHKCQWCSKEYTGNGYNHLGGTGAESYCASATNGWENTDQYCSIKCCEESWNSSH